MVGKYSLPHCVVTIYDPFKANVFFSKIMGLIKNSTVHSFSLLSYLQRT